MQQIWKYEIKEQVQTIQMPAGAKILTLKNQLGKAVRWALVEPDNEIETRTFHAFMSGENIDEIPHPFRRHYIDTVQLRDLRGGAFVFHVFEVL